MDSVVTWSIHFCLMCRGPHASLAVLLKFRKINLWTKRTWVSWCTKISFLWFDSILNQEQVKDLLYVMAERDKLKYIHLGISPYLQYITSYLSLHRNRCIYSVPKTGMKSKYLVKPFAARTYLYGYRNSTICNFIKVLARLKYPWREQFLVKCSDFENWEILQNVCF